MALPWGHAPDRPAFLLTRGGSSSSCRHRKEELPMPDPIDRLQTAAQKIDELFGADYARSHPEVLVVVMQSAASDWAAQRLGVAIGDIAAWPRQARDEVVGNRLPRLREHDRDD